MNVHRSNMLTAHQLAALQALAAKPEAWLRAWEAETSRTVMDALIRRGFATVVLQGGDLRYRVTARGRLRAEASA